MGRYGSGVWKFEENLAAPLVEVEGCDIISMDAVDPNNGKWEMHMCSKYKTAFAGQLTVFRNTERTRNLFRQVDLGGGMRHQFDEREFPAAVYQNSNILVGHVFGQVTDQLGKLNGA